MLMNHIPDKYEHLVRYYGHYSNRSRGTRKLIENGQDKAGSIRTDDRQPNEGAGAADNSYPPPPCSSFAE